MGDTATLLCYRDVTELKMNSKHTVTPDLSAKVNSEAITYLWAEMKLQIVTSKSLGFS